MANAKPGKPNILLTANVDPVMYKPCCPQCGAAIQLQATVETFGEPQGWDFYGYQGERWIKCRGELGAHPYTHFITLLNGRQSHRIAWIAPDKTAEATQDVLL